MTAKKAVSQKRTPLVSVRLNRDSEKHNQIKRLRWALASKGGEELTILETYERVIEAGTKALE